LVAVTFTPSTTAPLASVTVPRTEPVIVCAAVMAVIAKKQKRATIPGMKNRRRKLHIFFLPPK
jgi:hypothetical protein